MQDGQPLETVSDMVRRAVADAQRTVQEDAAQEDLAAIASDLREMDGDARVVGDQMLEQLPEMARAMAENTPSSPSALGLPAEAVDDLNLTREDEAIPILGLPIFSLTEDMAGAMRLHAMGWHSVFHPEILAYGLAPEDLGAALQQRLRWAQGTIQVLLRENPFTIRGLSLPQRLQYFTTMYSYFSGFATLVYLLAPIVYLFTGVSPISSVPGEFLVRLVPYLVLNRITLRYIAWGLSILRGEQYSVGLFSLWIYAVVSILFGSKPTFIVTSKQRRAGNHLRLVWPQLLIVCATVAAILYGCVMLAMGGPRLLGATLISAFWGGYNILMLSAILRAAVYRPPSGWQARPPAFLFPDGEQPAL
jgi:cellulose synthase (UDP-forming)